MYSKINPNQPKSLFIFQSCTGLPAPWVDYGLPRPPHLQAAQVDFHARCPHIDNDTSALDPRTFAENRTCEISRPTVQYSEHSNVAALPLSKCQLLLCVRLRYKRGHSGPVPFYIVRFPFYEWVQKMIPGYFHIMFLAIYNPHKPESFIPAGKGVGHRSLPDFNDVQCRIHW